MKRSKYLSIIILLASFLLHGMISAKNITIVEIFDGTVSGGNEYFYFLPELVPNPAFSGTLDKSLKPEIEILYCTFCLKETEHNASCDAKYCNICSRRFNPNKALKVLELDNWEKLDYARKARQYVLDDKYNMGTLDKYIDKMKQYKEKHEWYKYLI